MNLTFYNIRIFCKSVDISYAYAYVRAHAYAHAYT